MPVLAYSLRSIYHHSKDKEILREFLYPLIRYYDWWRSERDLGDGLLVAIHNWETGLDASPAYDPAFHTYITELNQSAFVSEYPKFWELMETYKFVFKWNVSAILDRASPQQPPSSSDTTEALHGKKDIAQGEGDRLDTWFMVKDVALNSVFASSWNILADLARDLDDEESANHCDKESSLSTNAILTKMWIPAADKQDPTSGSFQTLYIDNDGVEKSAVANTIQNLFPLLLKGLPEEKVLGIVSQLEDERKFFGPFAVPTVSMDDPQFSATFEVDLMWRGPVWGFTNWFILEGLGVHNKLAVQVSTFLYVCYTELWILRQYCESCCILFVFILCEDILISV